MQTVNASEISDAERIAEHETTALIDSFRDRKLEIGPLADTLVCAGALLAARTNGPRGTAQFLRAVATKIEALLQS